MTVRGALESVARQVSPRHRRWQHLLRSLDLDPGALPRPVAAPGARDVLVCGSPRSGTALLAAMLWQPPRSVCVMEPWDAMRLPPAELFASLRGELGAGVLRRGRLDVSALEARGEVAWCRDGEQHVRVDLDDDAIVAAKLPAFWRYLDLLPDTRFLVCLRSPLEVIASYRATPGRLRRGLEYDAPFHASLNASLLAATDDDALRRILLYDRVNAAIVRHLGKPNVFAVRYERWHDDADALLAEIGAFLDVDLGAPRARVAAPRSPALPPEEIELVRTHCTTAAALGYAL